MLNQLIRPPKYPLCIKGLLLLFVLCSSGNVGVWGQIASGLGGSAPRKADSSLVNDMNEEFKKFYSNDPKHAEQIGLEALELAKAINYIPGIIKMSNNLGVLYSGQGEYGKSLELLEGNLTVLQGDEHTLRRAHCLNNIGGVYYKIGDQENALKRYQEALPLYTSMRDTTGVLHILNNLGTIRQDQGRYNESLDAFTKIMRFGEATGDSALMGAATNNLGNLYLRQDQAKEAESYFERSLELHKNANDKFGMVASMVGLAKVRSSLGDHVECKRLFREALALSASIGDLFGLSESHIALAEEFVLQEEYDSALVHAREALDISRSIGRTQSEALALTFIGRSRVEQGNPEEAIRSLMSSQALCDQFHYREMSRDNYKFLAQAHAAKGSFKEAYEYFDRFFVLHDSIFTLEANNQLSELAVQFRTEEKVQTIGELEQKAAEGETQLDRVSQSLVFFIACAAILFLLLLFFAYRFRIKKRLSELNRRQRESEEWQRRKLEKQNQQIRQINANLEDIVEKRTQAVLAAKEELDAFLYQSAHALRRPLLRVEGLVSLLKPKLVDAEDEVLVESLDQTIVGMDALLHKLVKVNEVQNRDPELVSFFFPSVLNAVVSKIETGNVRIERDFPEDLKLASDKLLIQWLLENLVENSIVYSRIEYDPWVRVGLESKGDLFVLTVADNGKGIPDGQEPHVMEMFYRADASRSGSGLGLYLVAKIVEKLHGNIRIMSRQNGGTEVVVELPRHDL